MVTSGRPLLPVLATAVLSDPRGTRGGLLVSARAGRVLHVVVDNPGRTLTPTGRVRRHIRPMCGRAPRGWRPASVDGRPLCRTCARTLGAKHSPEMIAAAARRVTPADLAETLLTATDLATVSAAQSLLLASGHTAKVVQVSDGDRPEPRTARLTQLVAEARSRLTRSPRPFRDDPAFVSFVERRPTPRFPRRVS